MYGQQCVQQIIYPSTPFSRLYQKDNAQINHGYLCKIVKKNQLKYYNLLIVRLSIHKGYMLIVHKKVKVC